VTHRMTVSWPTAAVVITGIVAAAAIAILGPLAGLDADTITTLLGTTSVLGTVLAGLMRQLVRPERPRRQRAEPIWRDREPPDSGAGLALLLVALAGHAALSSGCGGPPEALRRGTTAAAMAVVELDAPLAAGYTRAHREALAASDGWEAYDERMGAWPDVERAARGTAAGLLSLDALLDAWDSARHEQVLSAAACVAVSIERLVRLAESVGLEIPPALRTALSLLRVAEVACTEGGE
jgi:hypothetical protein